MKATMDMIRAIRAAATVKTSRNFYSFFADRIVQAFSRNDLVDAIEHLAKSVNCDVQYVAGEKTARFI